MSKNPAAVALGSLGGKAGTGAAKARATSFTSASAKAALAARWAKAKRKPRASARRSNKGRTRKKKAWEKLMALHGCKLPVSTLNEFHRSVNVLCNPELVIGRHGIMIKSNVTQRQEMRSRCRSSWDVCSLARETKWSKPPRWNSRRETFAAFILRAVGFYKGVKLPKAENES